MRAHGVVLNGTASSRRSKYCRTGDRTGQLGRVVAGRCGILGTDRRNSADALSGGNEPLKNVNIF
jgi:hypothetical protein